LKQYEAYFFDLYGTLVDIHTDETKPSFWKAVAARYAEHGAAYDGRTLRESYRALCAAETARLRALHPDAGIEIDLLPVFRALYERKGVSPDPGLPADTAWFFRQRSTCHLRAYAGARELLEVLRAAGRRVILLSNAQSCFTRPELDLLGLTDCFDRIYISSEAGFQKPDPRFFAAPLRDLGLDPADCLMIGNDPVCDPAGAAKLGMDAVYIRSGLSPRAAPPSSAVLTLPSMDLRRLKRLLLVFRS
jgi:putative hydrolase of the HAD superfamily